MNRVDLDNALTQHVKWVNGEDSTRADLTRAVLTRADLTRAVLTRADLTRADLTRADLTRAVLTRAVLTGAVLRGAVLRDAVLRDADLTDAVLRDADLTGADLTGAHDMLDATKWLAKTFDADTDGVIVYKAVGNTYHTAPSHWKIEVGAFLTEVVNPNRTDTCGCGVSFATEAWCRGEFAGDGVSIWRCRIRWMDLAGVIVPYNTDGKARCSRLELIEQV